VAGDELSLVELFQEFNTPILKNEVLFLYFLVLYSIFNHLKPTL
jgi:hypothetical protein